MVPSFKLIFYFDYELRFNGVFARHNLPRMKEVVYVVNFDDKKIQRTHWVSLFIERNTAVLFDSFGTEYIIKQNQR